MTVLVINASAFILLLMFFQAMESKLLVGGKNIIDHTNEQQKMLEMKRQEIAEQVKFCVFQSHVKHINAKAKCTNLNCFICSLI